MKRVQASQVAWRDLFSQATESPRVNYVRQILDNMRPGLILLSGGFPPPEAFPVDLMPLLEEQAVKASGPDIYQYDATAGNGHLRNASKRYLESQGLKLTGEHAVHVYTGSQQVLYLVGDALLDPGDHVIVEKPTYLGALKAFDRFRPEYLEVQTDEEGIVLESLTDLIEAAIKLGKKPKFIYSVPNFHNPTGATTSLARRTRIAEVITHFGIPLLEDDPYRALRYRGEDLPPIQSLAPHHVIYTTTMSKILAPSVRIGIVAAPSVFLEQTADLKQGIDLNTGRDAQEKVAVYLSKGFLSSHIPRIKDIYKPRFDAILSALEVHFSRGYSWGNPEGGMFVWVTCPKEVDTEKLLPPALEAGVAYVPGISFYANSDVHNTMRLNFSNQTPEMIEEGIRRLSQILPT